MKYLVDFLRSHKNYQKARKHIEGKVFTDLAGDRKKIYEALLDADYTYLSRVTETEALSSYNFLQVFVSLNNVMMIGKETPPCVMKKN